MKRPCRRTSKAENPEGGAEAWGARREHAGILRGEEKWSNVGKGWGVMVTREWPAAQILLWRTLENAGLGHLP